MSLSTLTLPLPPNYYSQTDQSALRREIQRADSGNAKNNTDARFNNLTVLAAMTVAGPTIWNGAAQFNAGVTIVNGLQVDTAQVSGNFTFSALTPPATFTVSGFSCSRLALIGVLGTQSANTVWCGPASGAAASMTARFLQMVDLPDYVELGVPDATVVTVANTTTPKSALGKVLPLAANEPKVGDCYRMTCRGVYGSALAAPNIQLDIVDIGGNVVCSTGTNAVAAASLANRGWEVVVDFVCTAVGAVAGRLEVQGRARLSSSVTAGQDIDMENTATQTFNTTIANSLALVVTWGTAAAGNTISCRQTIWEKLAA